MVKETGRDPIQLDLIEPQTPKTYPKNKEGPLLISQREGSAKDHIAKNGSFAKNERQIWGSS
jgi:hypothetical protein